VSMTRADLDRFIAAADSDGGSVLVSIDRARGSTPREGGAFMLVSRDATLGTIGGGQLEYMAMDAARRVLRDGAAPRALDIPLGPDIGQCCGGRVAVSLEPVTAEVRIELHRRLAAAEKAAQPVYIMGAGHVGRALADALAPLPVLVTLVDTRPEALELAAHHPDRRLTAVPEAEVRAAPPGTAFVVLTHDHALDFLIAREVLERGDAAYAGMIGSKTKLAAFRSWLRAERVPPALADGLICPIGGDKIRDKRPAVIAALAAAEILVQCTAKRVEADRKSGAAADSLGDG